MRDSTIWNAYGSLSKNKFKMILKFYFPEVMLLGQIQDPFYQFLKAARGNWRNAIYLYCGRSACPKDCGGFLMAADTDGAPVLIPVKSFEALSGETVDPDECSSILHKQAFESAYALAILWRTVSSADCPLTAFTTTNTSNK